MRASPSPSGSNTCPLPKFWPTLKISKIRQRRVTSYTDEVKRRTQLLLRAALFARPLNYELAARGSRTIAIRLRKPRDQFLDVRRADAGDLIVAWAAVKRAIASGLDIPECRRSHQPIQRWV